MIASGLRRALRYHSVKGLLVAAFALRSRHALAGDEAAAEALFLEAKKLVAQGEYAKACPKFAESNRLDRGAGTLIHLADCYEKAHRSATAWATFRDAASAAQALGRADWQKLAAQRAATLEPKLAKLTVRVAAPGEKIEITRDAVPMTEASWNIPIPVDVGMYSIVATAPARKPFRTTVAVANDGDRIDVVIPRLEVEPTARTRSNEVAPRESTGSSRRTLGVVLGGVGVAGLATGAVMGLVSLNKNNESKRECPTDGPCASEEAVRANESAKTFGLVSTVSFVAGAAALAGGAILYFTAPSPGTGAAHKSGSSKPEPAVRVIPSTDGRSGSVAIVGVF